MPEVHLKIEWPGEKPDEIYSPSTVINQYFITGEQLTLTDFESKVTEALNMASQRVYQRFGYECTSAMTELDRVKNLISGISDKTTLVKIL
jgi:uncharacterized repeat protein (TIGR04042 family)